MIIVRIKKSLTLLAILVPPISMGFYIYHYGITVPFWDEWGVLIWLDMIRTGKLTFTDLWVQHNEHRIFFPKLLMLTIAHLTDWHMLYELYVNLICAGMIFFFLYLLLRNTFNQHDLSYVGLLLIIFSFLIFSPAQAANFMWGWQIQIFLSVFCVVVSIWSISHLSGEMKSLFISIGAAVVSSYSFNNGLLTWVVVSFLILSSKRNWLHKILWFLAFAITIFFYYYGYNKPSHHPDLLFSLRNPDEFFGYALAYLGSPLAFWNKNISIFLGIFIAIIIGFSSFRIIISAKRLNNLDRMLPWMAMGWYALLSAFATAIGRAGFGINQALETRYITIATLSLIGALVIIVIWFKENKWNDQNPLIRRLDTIAFVSIIIFPLFIISYIKGVNGMIAHKKYLDNSAPCLENVDMATDDCLKILYPNAADVRKMSKILFKLKILKEIDWQKIAKMPGGLMNIDILNGKTYEKYSQNVIINLNNEEEIKMSGWAIDNINKNSGRRVYVVFNKNEKEIVIPTQRHRRQDVASYFGVGAYKNSGWLLSLKATNLEKGMYSIFLRILESEGKGYFEIRASKPILVLNES